MWLLLAVVAYFAVSFALSWLRAVELQTTTWDQGLYQQALWSTAHGRAFYETADVETGGYHSLLQVHSVFLFYLLVPLYAVLPYEATLFAVQSLVVATAAIPLYLLGRDLTRSSRLALVAAVAYLVWTPILSSNLYDFHPEAFLPLELFTIVLLWERERYVLGAAVAAVAVATIELAPVLLFFVGIFFLLPSREAWRRWRAAADGRFPGRTWTRDLRSAFSSPRVRVSVVLVGASAVAYLLLLYLRVDVLAATLGTSPLPNVPTGYVIGGTPSSLGLSLQNLGLGFGAKLTYWILIIALLGFVPLLAPRALVLALPWFGFTMLSSNLNYVELGFQYGFIASSSLLVAFAYGLPRAVAFLQPLTTRTHGSPSANPPPTDPRGHASALRRRSRILVVAFVVLVGVNVALSPVNPLMQNVGSGSAYRISYTSAGGFADVEHLAALIPAGASVLASDNLFPLVANDENAYSFFWTENSFLLLPFNATHLPQFVLVAANRTAAVPAWLAAELYLPSAFGVRGVDWSSTAGPILLFESGYTGSPATYGTLPVARFVDAGSTLADAATGYPTTAPGSHGPGVAASAPGALGTFFYGPWASLPAGNFTITLLVNVSTIPGAPAPSGSERTLWIGGSAFAQPLYFSENLTFSDLSAPSGTAVTFPVSLSEPTIQFVVQGAVLGTNVQVFLDELEVVPA